MIKAQPRPDFERVRRPMIGDNRMALDEACRAAMGAE
jgi:hypothetical protein